MKSIKYMLPVLLLLSMGFMNVAHAYNIFDALFGGSKRIEAAYDKAKKK